MFKHITQVIFLLVLLIGTTLLSYSEEVNGVVKGQDPEGNISLLPKASVQWLNSKVGTYTDKKGEFTINKPANAHKLIIRYVGYVTDTIHVPHGNDLIEVVLRQHLELEGVEVTGKEAGHRIEKASISSSQTITATGLEKAACCNLGESFQTNASVDVSYSDAVSGAKQISLLGLQGKYTQMMTENMPNLRGAAIKYGLNYVPGPWMNAISISKGTASVRNGFESITGQINVAYKDPHTSEPFYLNLFGSRMGRFEANANSNYILSPTASTMLFVHGNMLQNPMDHNGDSFVDHPIVSQINLFNRWNFNTESWENKSGVKYLYEDRQGGQLSFIENDQSPGYGMDINTQRVELFTKNGFIFGEGRSIGTMLSANYHKQNSFYGINQYDVNQTSLYANFLYDSPIFNEQHSISTGFSWQYDNYEEYYNSIDHSRDESVPGVFMEYKYTGIEKLTVTGGIRADNHNQFGTFYTPRVHAKYDVSDFTIVRASAGKGFRTANIFAENTGIMASSREFVISDDLAMEEAWNYGLNFTTDFQISDVYITFNADYYRTEFINQVIVDLDHSVEQAIFYNLDGESYSNSLQFEFIIEPFQGVTLNTAYRWNDVKQTIDGELTEKPMMSPHKGFLNIAYTTYAEDWLFDVTFEFQGSGRLPKTSQNPAQYQRPEYYDPFMLLHAQITKKFEGFEIYLGGENLTNYIQPNPIIASDDPYGQYFDSSMIYGPIYGQNVYMGIRYNI